VTVVAEIGKSDKLFNLRCFSCSTASALSTEAFAPGKRNSCVLLRPAAGCARLNLAPHFFEQIRPKEGLPLAAATPLGQRGSAQRGPFVSGAVPLFSACRNAQNLFLALAPLPSFAVLLIILQGPRARSALNLSVTYFSASGAGLVASP